MVDKRKGETEMKLAYTVSKEKGGQWYCHQTGFPGIPCAGSFGDKKHALKFAADSMGLPLKEYMKLRKQQGSGGSIDGYEPKKGTVK